MLWAAVSPTVTLLELCRQNRHTATQPQYLHMCMCMVQSYIHLQTSMNVWLSHLAMQVLPAPTHSGPSHVLATRGTLEMDWRAMVGAYVHADYTSCRKRHRAVVVNSKQLRSIDVCSKCVWLKTSAHSLVLKEHYTTAIAAIVAVCMPTLS